MSVGQNRAIAAEDHTRPNPLARPTRPSGHPAARPAAPSLYLHHRRPGALRRSRDGIRICVQRFALLRRRTHGSSLLVLPGDAHLSQGDALGKRYLMTLSISSDSAVVKYTDAV